MKQINSNKLIYECRLSKNMHNVHEHWSPCTTRTLRLPYIRVTVHVRKWLKIAIIRVGFLDFDMGVHEWASVVFPFVIRISNESLLMIFHSLRIINFSYDDIGKMQIFHLFFLLKYFILGPNRSNKDNAFFNRFDQD